jgi:hypothetical protein
MTYLTLSLPKGLFYLCKLTLLVVVLEDLLRRERCIGTTQKLKLWYG